MSEPLDLLWVDPLDFGANAPRVNAWRERGGDQDVPYRRADWRPIETAPKDGTPILIARGGEVDGALWNPETDRWDTIGPSNIGLVPDWPTHWQPLPEPPE